MSRVDGLPAGDFSAWLRAVRSAHLEGGAVDVPCGDCAACCTSSYFVHIAAGEAGTLARVPAELLFAAPVVTDGTLLLGYDGQGRCPLLHGRLCAIYEDRPRTCRLYDCRVFAAAGIGSDRDAISRRARRWEFGYPSALDRREHDAVRAAARFLREHAAAFPDGLAPADPADVAITALKVYEVFVERPEGYEGGARTRTEQELALAVIHANERFDAARSVPAPVVREASG